MKAKGMKDIAIQKYNELTSGLTQGFAQRNYSVNGLLHNASYFNGIMHIHAVQVTEQLVQQWVEDEKTTITYVERRTSKFTISIQLSPHLMYRQINPCSYVVCRFAIAFFTTSLQLLTIGNQHTLPYYNLSTPQGINYIVSIHMLLACLY